MARRSLNPGKGARANRGRTYCPCVDRYASTVFSGILTTTARTERERGVLVGQPERGARNAEVDAARAVTVRRSAEWEPRHGVCFAEKLAHTLYGFIKRVVMQFPAWREGAPNNARRDYEFAYWKAVRQVALNVSQDVRRACERRRRSLCAGRRASNTATFDPRSSRRNPRPTITMSKRRCPWARREQPEVPAAWNFSSFDGPASA